MSDTWPTGIISPGKFSSTISIYSVQSSNLGILSWIANFLPVSHYEQKLSGFFNRVDVESVIVRLHVHFQSKSLVAFVENKIDLMFPSSLCTLFQSDSGKGEDQSRRRTRFKEEGWGGTNSPMTATFSWIEGPGAQWPCPELRGVLSCQSWRTKPRTTHGCRGKVTGCLARDDIESLKDFFGWTGDMNSHNLIWKVATSTR